MAKVAMLGFSTAAWKLAPRYTGAVYRASGRTHVGTTQEHGRYDRDKQYDKPEKDVWLRPLRRDWKRTLNR